MPCLANANARHRTGKLVLKYPWRTTLLLSTRERYSRTYTLPSICEMTTICQDMECVIQLEDWIDHTARAEAFEHTTSQIGYN